MNKITACLPLICFLSALSSCTDFEEDLITLAPSVNVSNITAKSDNSEYTIILTCGEEWDITAKPEWITFGTINAYYDGGVADEKWFNTPRWKVVLILSSNNGKDRDGVILISSASGSTEIEVFQEGVNGQVPSGGTTVSVTDVTLNHTELTLYEGDTEQLKATIHPDEATDKTVNWSSNNESVATVDKDGLVTAIQAGTAVITVTTTDSEKSATCSITVYKQTTGTHNGYFWVDLGLSVKWATCNVGATKPEEYGDFFAWGETESYFEEEGSSITWKSGKEKGYNWASYKWCEGSSTTLTRYNSDSSYGTVDNCSDFSEYNNQDDAARINWGSNWRTPTKVEWFELKQQCNWLWKTNYNGTGINGYLLTSKNSEYPQSLFLPAAGYWLSNNHEQKGVEGAYLSSIILYNTNIAGGSQLLFSSDNGVYFGALNRCMGFSVRPVYGVPVLVSGIRLDRKEISLYEGETEKLEATVLPLTVANKTVKWSSSKPSIASVENGTVTALKAGDATITVTAEDGSYSANCKVTVLRQTTGTTNGHDWVDLGLPSGLKWATCNVGATKPEEYGDYFAWGETSPKSDYDYSWETYKWCNGKYNSLTKYNTMSDYGSVDNKTELDLSDDAARVNWKGTWRMPTDEEWTELRNNCTCIWTNQGGKNGCMVTSKTNGKSIFFPATGERNELSPVRVGTNCPFWSSSLYKTPSQAWAVDFDSDSQYNTSFIGSTYITNRKDGFPIRPVIE